MHYLYLITTSNDETKIGISGDVEKRFKTLQAANPQQLLLYVTLEYSTEEHARNVETSLHHYFDDRRIHFEWFDIPASEVIAMIDLVVSVGQNAITIEVKQVKRISTNTHRKAGVRTNTRQLVHEYLSEHPNEVDLPIKQLASNMELSTGLVSEERNNWKKSNGKI